MAVATTYTLTGPTAGRVGDVLTYTVSIGSDTSAAVTITPAASVGTSGTFNPATVTLATATPTVSFTFTPSKLAAPNNISTTDSASLADPPAIALAVTADLELTGPLVLPPKTATTYTVELGPGTFTGSVTVTPSGPAGWTYSPSTVSLTNADRRKTFAVTADEPESGTLTVAANQAFAVPGAGLSLKSAYSTTSLATTVKNISGETLFFSFLGDAGRTLAADETYAFFGVSPWSTMTSGLVRQRNVADLEYALLHNTLEIMATPATIVTDGATGAVKAFTLVNGTAVYTDPSYGPHPAP